MKYIKPELEISKINFSTVIASNAEVDAWLEEEGMEDAEIFSFFVMSWF